MDIKTSFLEKATKWVVGGDLYKQIKQLVEFYFEDDTMTGEEKRAEVIRRVKEIRDNTATVFINIALEVAYMVILDSTKK